MMGKKIGVICGFQAEVDCFQRAAQTIRLGENQFLIAMSGASSNRAAEQAEKLVAQDVDLLVSYGIAGGLDPRHQVSDVIYSNHVVTTLDESYGRRPQTKPRAKELAMRAGSLSDQASVCGVDEIIFMADDKAKLHRTTKAAIADMESHAVARIATRTGKPFIVLRSVSDSARDSLPSFIANGVSAEGQPQTGPIILGLLKNPFALPTLLKIQKNTKLALSSLEAATCKLLPVILKN